MSRGSIERGRSRGRVAQSTPMMSWMPQPAHADSSTLVHEATVLQSEADMWRRASCTRGQNVGTMREAVHFESICDCGGFSTARCELISCHLAGQGSQ